MSGMALSPDGKTLALGDGKGAVERWDPTTAKKSATLLEKELQGEESIFLLVFSPDGQTLAAAAYKKGKLQLHEAAARVRLWDVARRRLRAAFELQAVPGSLAFSPNGKTLAIGHGETVQLRDPATGRLRASLKFDSYIPALAFSPDGRVLAARGGDSDWPGVIQGYGEVRFWDVLSEKMILALWGHADRVWSMALSSDGRLLAVTTGRPALPMNLWNVSAVTGRKPPGRPPAAPPRGHPDPLDAASVPAAKLTPEELEKRWSDLAGAGAARAYQAIWALAGASEQTVPFLARHLKPVPPIDPERVERLIADLESDQFAVRQQAGLELEKAEEPAEPALRKALQGKARAETREKAEQLLANLDGPVTAPEKLQALRAVEVLEYIGSAEAWQVLETLAQGAPQGRVTQEALFSLERLSKRAAFNP